MNMNEMVARKSSPTDETASGRDEELPGQGLSPDYVCRLQSHPCRTMASLADRPEKTEVGIATLTSKSADHENA